MNETGDPPKDGPAGDSPLEGGPVTAGDVAPRDVKSSGSVNEAPASPSPAPNVQAAPEIAPVEDARTAQPLIAGARADELAQWNEQVRRRMRQQTRRSFVVGGAAALVGFTGWRWLMSRRADDGLPWPFRRMLEVNEQLARDYYRRGRLAPDFRGKAPLEDRVNGDLGLDDPIDPSAWRLSVEGLEGRDEPLELAPDAIKKLPRVEMTAEFKCIEGWSVFVEWAGAGFSDFVAAYPPATRSGDPPDPANHPEDLPAYVGMETPDGGYYVGLDMESMLHPQTLLAYEMNGAPLTQEHGAPLRLVTPLKYGVKNIKRIGTIRYSTRRPADYWAERGYDWYIGL